MNRPADALERLVEQAGQLYTLPAVAVEVLQLTNCPKVDTRQLKTCLERDPALTAKLLRVVNSSLFGLSRQVTCLQQALALLGIKPLKLLVLGFSLPEALFVGLGRPILQRYWKKALTKAVAARELASQFWHLPGDEAFLAGLLQDLGQLVLLQRLQEPYVALAERVLEEGLDLVDAEREAMGFDHLTLSVRLLERWGLPATLLTVLARSRELRADGNWAEPRGEAAAEPLALVLDLADKLTAVLVDGRASLLRELLQQAGHSSRLNEALLADLVRRLQERVCELAAALSLDLPDELNYPAILAEAHRQLALASAEVAEDLVRAQATADPDPSLLLHDVRSLAAALAGMQSHATNLPNPPPPRGEEYTNISTASPTSRPHASVAASLTAASSRAARIAPAGLASDQPALARQLASAVAQCRQRKLELSLLLLELPAYDDLAFGLGAEGADRLMAEFEDFCRQADHPGAATFRTRDRRLAMILPDCDRPDAVRLGNEILALAQEQWMLAWAALEPGQLMVAGGVASVAVPPRNFPPGDLITAADRCLYAAVSAGGNTLKSIEIR